MSKLLRVLLVEDSEDDAELLLCELERNGCQTLHLRVDTAPAMQTALETQQWDIVIADYSMPQFSAIAALQLLQEKQLDLPFIIVSGSIGEETAVAAMKAGAHDYLIKGNLARLVPAIEREIREAQLRSERHQALEKLRYLAFYDELTGLPNRTLFLEYLRQVSDSQSVRAASPPENSYGNRPSPEPFAVLFLDVDRYQIVKYSLGHLLADRLLVAMGRWLKNFRRSTDIIARVGIDEFAILLSPIQSLEEARNIAQKIHQALKAPFNLDGAVVFSTTSIGIVMSQVGYQQPEELLRAADIAMHHAKLEGRGQTTVFDINMQERAIERLQLETDLQRAIKQQTRWGNSLSSQPPSASRANFQQLHLFYQPIISLKTGKVTGFEALVRWTHPTRGAVSPAEFIPIAEKTGLIIPLGEWVLLEACRQLSIWKQEFSTLGALNISVNLSGIQLTIPDLPQRIADILRAHNLSGGNIKLEITESILMENASKATELLAELKQQQIQLCIDDFGTGYSSLSYLHRLPIDTIKIDRSFINRMESDSKNADIVKSIVNLAHSLDLNVVAEGVENREQLIMLKALDCEDGQGYLFSRPKSAEDITEVMKTWSDSAQNDLNLLPSIV
ncbi:MAG: EAL domain-containing protein [Desertifilum sp. SIO1I2]|nr:EAL domain-containing protein [Desertifilum sp. SIO1I2]